MASDGRPLDVVVVKPDDARIVRRAAMRVAEALDLPDDWLNDGAKGFIHGLSLGQTVFESDRLSVRALAPEQLLAMKLCAFVRQWAADCLREQVAWPSFEQPGGLVGDELVVAAAVVELLADRAGQARPPWTARVPALSTPLYFVRWRFAAREKPAYVEARSRFDGAGSLPCRTTWSLHSRPVARAGGTLLGGFGVGNLVD